MSPRLTGSISRRTTLKSGAAGVAGFALPSIFQHGHPKWPIPEYQSTLNSLASLDALLKLSRRHAVTFRDVTVPGETYRSPLPASGTQLSFTLPLGPAPSPGWQAEATVGITDLPADDALPTVSINGAAGKLQGHKPETNGDRLLTYAFPLAALRGTNCGVVTVTAAGNDPVKVLRVEVSLRPGD